ncbi:DNA-binding protein SMUBP-2 [Geranomyces michiganensis]|nr:DNA-binding protein SMUBP-2 [Geranomyces michiganensis]
MTAAADDLHPHLAHLATLLALERSYALSTSIDALTHLAPTTLQARGLALLALRLAATRTGLGGKLLAEFQRDDAAPFPAQHSFRVGDVVGVVVGKKRAPAPAGSDGQAAEGVVTRVEDARLTVAFEEDVDDAWEGKILRIDKLANDTPYVRMSDALTAIQRHVAANTLSPILCVMLKGQTPTFGDREEELVLYNDALNESQREAVSFALSARECALIHGPPGTGKTETVVELIRQFAKQGLRILVCGPSNISVDNIVERLSPSRIPLVRIGHPARVLPSVLSSTLDHVLKTSDAAALVLDIRAEIDSNLRKIHKSKSRSERKALWQANKDLRKDLRVRERAALSEIIARSRVVLATLAGCGARTILNAGEFDVVVVDEASQALEPETYLALLRAPRAVFAGDHRQLPPTVRSPDATKQGFTTTVFDRLAKRFPSAMRMLDTQYRMNEAIMGWASGAMYEGRLKGHDSVRARVLKDLEGVHETDETSAPVMWIDTAGCGMWEAAPPADDGKNEATAAASRSRTNPAEAELVAEHVKTLLAAGVAPSSIAVVTPYAAQAGLVRAELAIRLPTESVRHAAEIEVGTVDGFQGREKDAIVISMVRSNADGDVGFLRDERRMNVAVTRARRHVCVVGDSETMERAGGVLKGLAEWFFEHGEVVSAHGLVGVA